MPRKGSPYGPLYEKTRRALIGQPCEILLACSGAPATSADHDPPLSRHNHVEGAGCCRLRPACAICQKVQGRALAVETHRLKAHGLTPPQAVPAPSRVWA